MIDIALNRWLRSVLPVLAVLGGTVLPVRIQADESAARTSVLAGKWFPEDPAALRTMVGEFLGRHAEVDSEGICRAGVAPLGRYHDTGEALGKLVARLPRETLRVIVLTAWHPTFDHLPQDRKAMSGYASIIAKEGYQTPLGTVRLDPAAHQLRESGVPFADVPAAHYWEPGIEAILPFLQYHLETRFTIVPVVVDSRADPTILAEALVPLTLDEHTCLLATASLLNRDGTARGADGEKRVIEALVTLNDRILQEDRGLLAGTPLRVLLGLARIHSWRGMLVSHEAGRDSRAGHAAVAFLQQDQGNALLRQAARAEWHDPATKAAFQDALRISKADGFRGQLLSPQEQHLLLLLARNTIRAKLENVDLPAAPLYSDTLSMKRGCFVALKKHAEPRGSLGIIEATYPLALAVQRYAIAAALEDRRFEPATSDELPALTIEISVLTAPRTLEFSTPDELLAQLEPSVHGVVINHDGKRATYLPQVWAQISRKDLFLANLCRKGGMPADAWKDPAATTVQVYEVFTFDDADRQRQ